MYSAKEAAEMTGLTAAALRYYEQQQLLPPIIRTEQKYRQYSDADIEWIRMIQCLRKAKVPIRSIREYVLLLKQGGRTILQRRRMVRKYMEELHHQIGNLQEALALSQEKFSFYEEILDKTAAEHLTCLEEWALFKERRGNG